MPNSWQFAFVLKANKLKAVYIICNKTTKVSFRTMVCTKNTSAFDSIFIWTSHISTRDFA